MRKTKSEKLAICRALEAPGASYESVASDNGVSAASVRNWRKELSSELLAPTESAPKAESENEASALAAFGISSGASPSRVEDSASPISGTPVSGNVPGYVPSPLPDSVGNAGGVKKARQKPPTPKQLVGLLEQAQKFLIKGASVCLAVKIDPDTLEKLTSFSKEEREQLEYLAPYAADAVPDLMEQLPKIAAGAFCLMGLLSIGTRGFFIYRARGKTIALNTPEAVLTEKAK